MMIAPVSSPTFTRRYPPGADDQAVEPIHQALSQKALLPKEHLMDCGYLDAEHLVNPKTEYDVEIIGPVREDHSWQAFIWSWV